MTHFTQVFLTQFCGKFRKSTNRRHQFCVDTMICVASHCRSESNPVYYIEWILIETQIYLYYKCGVIYIGVSLHLDISSAVPTMLPCLLAVCISVHGVDTPFIPLSPYAIVPLQWSPHHTMPYQYCPVWARCCFCCKPLHTQIIMYTY